MCDKWPAILGSASPIGKRSQNRATILCGEALQVISPLLRWSSWLHLAKTYRWIWPPLSERPRWRTARSSPSRLPRKGQPSSVWAFGTPRKDETTPDAVCPRWRRISAADHRRIPRRRISSPRNRSYCRSCSSATGKVCLRRKCGFGDRDPRLAGKDREGAFKGNMRPFFKRDPSHLISCSLAFYRSTSAFDKYISKKGKRRLEEGKRRENCFSEIICEYKKAEII